MSGVMYLVPEASVRMIEEWSPRSATFVREHLPFHADAFGEYAAAAEQTAVYPGSGSHDGLVYAAMGLNGEAGEVAELIKKMLRDDGGALTPDRQAKLEKELGDVLWYVAAVARDAGLDLGAIAKANIAKLADRKARGVIGGSGDDR